MLEWCCGRHQVCPLEGAHWLGLHGLRADQSCSAAKRAAALWAIVESYHIN